MTWDPTDKTTCGCGTSISKAGYAKHKQSKKHLFFIENGYLKPSLIDPKYPVGTYARCKELKLDVQRRYRKAKREAKLLAVE